MKTRHLVLMHVERDNEHAELLQAAARETEAVQRVIRFDSPAAAGNYLFGTDETLSPTPNLILLDLEKSTEESLQFLKLVRSNPVTIGIPVVVLSCSEDDELIHRAYALGASSFITKPKSYDEFVIKMAEMNMYWSVTATLPTCQV